MRKVVLFSSFGLLLLLVVLCIAPCQVIAQEESQDSAPAVENDASGQASAVTQEPEIDPGQEQDPGENVENQPAEAAQDESTEDVAPEEAKNLNNQTYRDWLEQYGAWDKLDQVYASDQDEPEAVLKRAVIAMQSGNPQQALEIVEKTTPYEDNNSTEIKRLWIGGQAQRAMGDPARAVLWFSQAAKLMTVAQMRTQFQREPGLDLIWTDVWRKLFWVYAQNQSVSREGQAMFLATVLDQGLKVWGQQSFWRLARTAFDRTMPPGLEDEVSEKHTITAVNDLSLANREVLAKYLAEMSLGREDANATLESLGNEPLRLFWQAAHIMAVSGRTPDGLESFAQEHYFRPAAFLARPATPSRLYRLAELGLLQGDTELNTLRDNLLALSPQEAHNLLASGKAASLMTSAQVPIGFNSLNFAMALEARDLKTARDLWPELDKNYLPPSLLLAGIILYGQDAAIDQHWAGGLEQPVMDTLSIMAQAGGVAPALPHIVPFWTKADPARLKTLATDHWPLDPDILLAYWTQVWERSPNSDLARRVAFLFPEEEMGVLCTLYLADKAVDDRQLNLAAYYLSTVYEPSVNATLAAKRLEVTAEWQMTSEDMDGALATYEQLVATGAEISDVTRLKIAFLLQRKGRLAEGRDQLLTLWDRKDDMDTAMQAEIMFYLGEGEQAMGNSDTALDYFLNLAWEYPQESMWALTAMYRAANIYESREQYEPARKLLKTVIKNAQTDKQKAAAEARLADIEARMGKPSDLGAGSVPYPF